MSTWTWLASADGLIAWLFTYALHSTLLLGGAWFLARRFPLPVREAVWKSALVGGLLTASLHLAVGGPQIPGLSAKEAPAVQTTAPAPLWMPSFVASPTAQGANFEETKLATGTSVEAAGTTAMPWSPIAALSYLLGALGSLSLLIISYRRLSHRLRDRQALDGSVRAALESLLVRCGWLRSPRLTTSRNLAVPIAQGVMKPEICLPKRALSLATDEQESLLAHELAHVVRKDPAWLVLNRTIEALFFFQPLNRLARRRLQEIAEFRCDEWAARWTGKPESLARCLTEVAGWQLRQGSLPVAAMAQGTQGLRQRISRLLQPETSSARKPWWVQPALALALLLFALTVPGFAPKAQADGTGAAPAAQEAPKAPKAPKASKAPKAPKAPEVSKAPRSASAPKAPRAPRAPQAPESLDQEIRIPEIRIPEIRIPEIRIPEIRIPHMDITIPEIEIPEIEIPEIEIPEIYIPAMNLDGEALRGLTEEQLRALEQVQEEITRHLGPHLERLQEELQREIEPRLEVLTEEIERAQAAGEEARVEELHRVQEELHSALEEQHGSLQRDLHRELDRQRAVLHEHQEHLLEAVRREARQHRETREYSEALEHREARAHREARQHRETREHSEAPEHREARAHREELEHRRVAQEEARREQAAAREELSRESQENRAESSRQARELEMAAREVRQELQERTREAREAQLRGETLGQEQKRELREVQRTAQALETRWASQQEEIEQRMAARQAQVEAQQARLAAQRESQRAQARERARSAPEAGQDDGALETPEEDPSPETAPEAAPHS